MIMPEGFNVTHRTDHDYIRDTLLGQVEQHMAQGAAHYGPNNHNEMGLKGQFADMYRKFKPLKARLWDDMPEVEGKESTREICMDLIGHCLLTIAMIDRQSYVSGGSTLAVRFPQDDEVLLAAGWTKDSSGHLVAPQPSRADIKRGPEFRQVSVITELNGTRRCSFCTAILAHGVNTCNCAPE